jgi:hypothetical protein
MPQIPIVSGIYSDNGPDLRTSYPVNMMPVPKQSGVSSEFLRPTDGLVAYGTGPGDGRGGINWNDELYRVMGSKLVKIAANGAVTVLGDVGGSGYVSMTYSFDRLAIASGGKLFYWDGAALTQVTDPNLGTVLDVIWIDGYFMTTDGQSLVVTDILNPLNVLPFAYASNELDPDPIKALIKLRNEANALNRYTIEVFENVGTTLQFPFQPVDGAQIQKGTIGTHTCCIFLDALAFVGGGQNEAPGVYVAQNANTQKISTQEIDEILLQYGEGTLAGCLLEARNDRAHRHLMFHLPDRTLVYDAAASEALSQPIWFQMVTAVAGYARFRAESYVWCYDRWNVEDPLSTTIGRTDDTVGTHWGQTVRWEFGTIIIYNNSKSAIINELELVALTGRVALGENPIITTSYSLDGLTWSQDQGIRVGSIGQTNKRLCWFRQGSLRNMRMQRFRGDSDAHVAFLRLEAAMEPLNY